jgi:C1A family cysteine protease
VKAGDLRKAIADEKLGWRVAEHFGNAERIPIHGIGAEKRGLVTPGRAGRVDFAKVFAKAPMNPYLVQRARARKFLRANVKPLNVPTPKGMTTPAPELDVGHFGGEAMVGGPTPSSVDWRSRWGWPWITSVRDQNPCESCWAFAAVALVEAMTRIEHCFWPHFSEGDVHKGMGAVCANTGGIEAAIDWIRQHSLADPDCFPWTVANIAYTPSPDRNGRSVRGSMDKTWVGSIADQKAWLDTVGPLGTWFEVWHDFDGYGSGVYKRSTASTNYDRGGHFMLVVGYDDAQGAWIVKNSWGTSWGMSGFALIGYGEADIDKYSKLGIRNLNPDPWTKRRIHNGNMIESGNGFHYRNFEMLATVGGGGLVQHWWRDNGAAGFPWHTAYAPFGGDAAVCPTLTGTTYNRNFEAVYMTTGGRLHHFWLDQNTHTWNDGGVFGPTDVWGVPGFVQGNYGKPGNFEVVVRTRGGQLVHWWRQNGPPWTWSESVRFGANIAFSGPSLIQSHYGTQGNFELVAVLNDGRMQHWWRDNDHGMTWHAGPTFGSGCSSGPCMIEGQFGASNENDVGNFELCVAAGGRVQHWWRNNHGDDLWRQSATFGHDVQAVAALVEGSFGFNLEVIVLRYDRKLQHYWRDGAGWHEGVVIGSA